MIRRTGIGSRIKLGLRQAISQILTCRRLSFSPSSQIDNFFQALAMAGAITQDEALAAVQTGGIPEVMQTYIDSITDPDKQFAVRMVLSGATQFERDNPLVDEFGHALGWSDEQIDELWRTAAAL
jgi:hypothetical protein